MDLMELNSSTTSANQKANKMKSAPEFFLSIPSTPSGRSIPSDRTNMQATQMKQGFEEVALRELPVLYRVARRMAGNGHEAEDIVGQALLNAARAWSAFDGRHPRSWLIRIVRNEYLATLRHGSSRSPHRSIEETDAIEDGPFEAISQRMMADEVVAAMDNLPEEYRLAVALCDMEEMSYEEAAIAMDVPVGTVRSRLYRGRNLLRRRLIGMEESL